MQLVHPRLQSAIAQAADVYRRRYPDRPVQPSGELLKLVSGWREQLDCSRIRGACSDRSKHSHVHEGSPLALAVDVKVPGVSKESDPRGHQRDFANIVRKIEPCIEWGGTYRQLDFPHFELPWDVSECDGGTPSGRTPEASVASSFAAATGLPQWTLPAMLAALSVALVYRVS